MPKPYLLFNESSIAFLWKFLSINMLAVVEGQETQEIEVFNFTGAGGVALAMYNTDEVCYKILSLVMGSRKYS